MPIYQYKCDECISKVEISRSMTEEEVAPKCLRCSQPMKKVFHSPTVNLVGGGFYRNGG